MCQLPRQLFPAPAEGQGQNRLAPLQGRVSPGNVALRGLSLPPCLSARPFTLVFPEVHSPLQPSSRALGDVPWSIWAFLEVWPPFVFLTLFPGHPCSNSFCVFIRYPAFLDIPWREFLCTPSWIPEMEGSNAASPSVEMIILLPVNFVSYIALFSRVILEFSG